MALDEKKVREAINQFVFETDCGADDDDVSELVTAVLACEEKPSVSRETILEWFKAAIDGEEFGMWSPNVEADLEAAGVEVRDD